MKTNNRFNVLLESNSTNNSKLKIDKNGEPKSSTFNNFKSNSSGHKSSRHQDDIDYRMFKETKLKKQKEEDIVKALDISNFPQLKSRSTSSVNKNKNKDQYKNSFADMMKNTTQILEENDDPANINNEEEDEIVKPGWVCIKQDNKTRQPICIYGDDCVNINNNIDERVSFEDPYYVFERLVTHYQKRKNEYIKTWGYEEYDKMFLFQNYDYEYFDNVDDNYHDFYKIGNNNHFDYINN